MIAPEVLAPPNVKKSHICGSISSVKRPQLHLLLASSDSSTYNLSERTIMSNLKYYAYPGWGEFARDNLGYSQAVRVGDRIELSGQGKLP